VLSASDKKAVVAAKLRYYQDHEYNRCVLFVRQDRIGAEQHIRQGDAWRPRRLSSATTKLSIPDVGIIGRLGDLYEATPLDPFPSTGR
jgi:hypothetical protein